MIENRIFFIFLKSHKYDRLVSLQKCAIFDFQSTYEPLNIFKTFINDYVFDFVGIF